MTTKTHNDYVTLDDIGFIGDQSHEFTDEDRESLREFFAERKRHPFAALDDIGRWGIENHVATPEDRAFFAQKAEESRQRYREMQRLVSESPIPKGYEIPVSGYVCAVAEPSPKYVP